MAMHPYEKPNEVDQYYTELANEIYHALDEACFTHQFKNVEEAKQLALSIAGYFEDVISGTCIWKPLQQNARSAMALTFLSTRTRRNLSRIR